MSQISQLEPKQVWSIFDEILKVPRPSKQEEQIRAYLLDFAKKHNLEAKTDAKGNVVIERPASAGCENSPTVVLQNHMDMVCEKEPTIEHDFMKDPINAVIEDGWVTAVGTTLGADCGIGMALALAALISPDVKAPKLEALFTVDEEQGLSGAKELDPNIITGEYLLNLDSEDEGEIFIGCAGGVDTLATFDAPMIDAPKGDSYKIVVSGLLGGHSGDDIEKGRAAATKLIAYLLVEMSKLGATLSVIDAGNLRNALARDAHAIIVIPSNKVQQAKETFDTIYVGVKNEFAHTDPGVTMTFDSTDMVTTIIEPIAAQRLLLALLAAPHGVIAMSPTMEGLVETSTNLASVKQIGDEILVTTSQRSSVESATQQIAATMNALFILASAKVVHTDGYPGWEPNPENNLTQIAKNTYIKIFSKQPKVKAIHAGLECGLLIEKSPRMQAISIGPTMRGVHSPSERLNIATTDQVWTYLIELLQVIGSC